MAAPPRRVRLDAVGGEARLHSPALPAFHARYQYCKRIFLSKVKLRAPRTMGATTDVLEDLPALYLDSVPPPPSLLLPLPMSLLYTPSVDNS